MTPINVVVTVGFCYALDKATKIFEKKCNYKIANLKNRIEVLIL